MPRTGAPAGAPQAALVHGDTQRRSGSTAGDALNGEPVALTAREFTLLLHMLEHRGQVRSRSQLQESLYNWDSEIESNAIEVHVHNLRRKLGRELIRTVHGQGYVIDVPPPKAD